jgi:2-oxoglutarate dehydrogenase E2 component (dihydrolipoamide succinyltransferase)
MPQMGESITTGTITKWHKAAGDKVELDEILFEISTDKVESEIPSPVSGRVEELLFKEGDTVDIQKLIAVIEDDLSVPFKGGQASVSAKTVSAVPISAAPSVAPVAAVAATNIVDDRFFTPLVKAMAKEAGVSLAELATVKGTGAAGRINKSDFDGFLATRGNRPAAASSAVQTKAPVSNVPAFAASERIQIVPMDNMRKTIAKNMQASKLISPHVNSIDEVDMTNLVKFRESFKNEFLKQEGFALTYTHFILYALVQALKEFPIVNSSIDGDNIIMKKDINLGCAVSVPGNGLVVPVIKTAESLNITGIARALNVLVNKAKTKKLTMDDLTGGTYTFTNNGSFGVLAATPVILQPQVGIFCVGTIQKRVMVMADDAMAIRQMMYSTHTYDHRIIDGEVGSRFLRHVINNLQTMNPASLF